MQGTVNGKCPASDCKYSVLWDGEAARDMRVRHGTGGIRWKCCAPLLQVCGVVRVEIWPRQNLRKIRRVVGPATHHVVMRRDDFLGDLNHVTEPIVL
jgi:hypothetical protein